MNIVTNAFNSINKSHYVEDGLEDKITLWSLRAILKCSNFSEFFSRHGFCDESLAKFLDLEDFIDSSDIDKYQIKTILQEKLDVLEDIPALSSQKILANNIKKLSRLLSLNAYEEQILEFFIVLVQTDLLVAATDALGRELSSNKVKKYLSIILDIPLKEVRKAFEYSSTFSKTTLLLFNSHNLNRFEHKVEIIYNEFADQMMTYDVPMHIMFKRFIRRCSQPTLTIEDYSHISSKVSILKEYIQSTTQSRESGVNILLYGKPGTGKTELTKVLAQSLNLKLYEVSYADESDSAIDGSSRVKAYRIAQSIIQEKRSLLLYDEAEDIFESEVSFFSRKRQKDKAWINRMLETNSIPTIWITNNIHSVDDAIIRRFDYVMELEVPDKRKRVEMIKRYTNNQIDEASIMRLASHGDISPAVLGQANKVASRLKKEKYQENYLEVINNTLEAQGYERIRSIFSSEELPVNYDASLINTNEDLEKLSMGVFENQNARICLYGPAGTGKSAYGKYLAEVLNKPVLLKKGSDLMSKWVGESEKNIAKAFEEAKREEAVLIFDEVDSFLMDRGDANQQWEITQVNEFLVQMENFNGIFIATTNLIDNLDKASLRRFDLKLEFSYLRKEQAKKMFSSYARELGFKRVSKDILDSLGLLKTVTPGDFYALTRQHRFRAIKNPKDMLERLKQEIVIKEQSSHKIMGFLR